MYFAHIMGIPVEETLLPIVFSVGGSLAAVKVGLNMWLKKHKCKCEGECKCGEKREY